MPPTSACNHGPVPECANWAVLEPKLNWKLRSINALASVSWPRSFKWHHHYLSPPKCVNARPQHQLPCSEEPLPLHCSTCWGDITWHLGLDPGELRPLCVTPLSRRPWQKAPVLLPAGCYQALGSRIPLLCIWRVWSSKWPLKMSQSCCWIDAHTDTGFRYFQGIEFNIYTTNWALNKVKSHRCFKWPTLKGLKLQSP